MCERVAFLMYTHTYTAIDRSTDGLLLSAVLLYMWEGLRDITCEGGTDLVVSKERGRGGEDALLARIILLFFLSLALPFFFTLSVRLRLRYPSSCCVTGKSRSSSVVCDGQLLLPAVFSLSSYVRRFSLSPSLLPLLLLLPTTSTRRCAAMCVCVHVRESVRREQNLFELC